MDEQLDAKRAQMMSESIGKGTEFLEKNSEAIVITLRDGVWNKAVMSNDSAKEFGRALDEQGKHSAASFGQVLRGVIAEAQAKFGYKIDEKNDNNGNKIITLSK
jgi:hypothetical protein